MQLKLGLGDIVEGKVTGIKPFGAFVAVDEEHQGLVHISEIAHQYVKDINNFLKVGDTVKVKVLKIDEASGKISLSIRAAEPEQEKESHTNQSAAVKDNEKRGFNTLEEKLKDWLKESRKS
ncbi:S1 domain-containing post-transcriptional regulator GSP13 [Terrilactibacillus sp. S3-3]|nr:S1 domain-containing post-transcriptional regulator GSP13 [Terrilactibacillus sp. S3-3]